MRSGWAAFKGLKVRVRGQGRAAAPARCATGLDLVIAMLLLRCSRFLSSVMIRCLLSHVVQHASNRSLVRQRTTTPGRERRAPWQCSMGGGETNPRKSTTPLWRRKDGCHSTTSSGNQRQNNHNFTEEIVKYIVMEQKSRTTPKYQRREGNYNTTEGIAISSHQRKKHVATQQQNIMTNRGNLNTRE